LAKERLARTESEQFQPTRQVKVDKKGTKGIKHELISKKSNREDKKNRTAMDGQLGKFKKADDMNDVLDLSLGTFKSIDNQINQAENMIAEFEH